MMNAADLLSRMMNLPDAEASAEFAQSVPSVLHNFDEYELPRVCYYTFVTEEEHGKTLLRCSRCQRAFYVSREAQKEHWKYHKGTCRRVDAEALEMIVSYDLKELQNMFGNLLAQCSGIRGQITSKDGVASVIFPIVVRISELMRAQDSYSADAGNHLHGICRTYIFCADDKVSWRIWGIPGMTQFLLYGEDLLTENIRKRRDYFDDGLPSTEYIDLVLERDDPELAKRARKLHEEEDAVDLWSGVNGAMEFCYLYFNLILCAAVRAGKSSCSIHDGDGNIRQIGKLPEVATRRALELWSNKLVMESCGDAMAPGASIGVTAMNKWCPNEKELSVEFDGELAPGLTFDAAVICALKEFDESGAALQYTQLLMKKPEVKSLVIWDSITMIRRARVCLAIISFLMNNPMGATTGFSDQRFSNDVWYQILDAAVGSGVRKLSVWEMAANHSCLGPKGMGLNDDVRAFFHFLIRRHEREENVRNVKGLLVAWNATPDLPSAKPKTESQMRSATEKLKCLELAQGPLIHADWLKYFDKDSKYSQDYESHVKKLFGEIPQESREEIYDMIKKGESRFNAIEILKAAGRL